jgi:hypothetical protein
MLMKKKLLGLLSDAPSRRTHNDDELLLFFMS